MITDATGGASSASPTPPTLVGRNLLPDFARLLPRGRKILVAVSGGVDSMVLLRILHQHSRPHRWKLVVAHLNHGLRGRSSDADQRLVEKVADDLKIAVIAERADVRAMARQGGNSIEMAARRVRHAFLASAARENGISIVATAHHADDQVELFFLRLFRGAGADGLSGMGPLGISPADPRIRIVRPLLRVTRAQIEAYARAERIPFREDASNTSPDFMRNRIRHTLLPLLEQEFQPAIRQVIRRAMDLLAAEADFSGDAALRWLAKPEADFDGLHRAVQRRVLQLQLITNGIAPDFELIEWLRRHPEKSCTVESGREIRRDRAGRVIISPNAGPRFDGERVEIAVARKQPRVLFDTLEISWRVRNVRKPPVVKAQPGVERFDADAVGARIVLRHWQRGDRFQPIGMSRAVKLQDLFANAKVPRAERHQRAVAANVNGEIFWVEGLRISERCKLRPQTRRVLEWRWQRA